MFERLGQFVSRQWLPLLVGWILALVVLWVIAPPLKTVIEDGDFKFLPKDLPSVQAEKLFKNAFENDLLKSSIVIVAHRDNASDGLTDEDKTYIDEKLVPRLAQLAGLPESGKSADAPADAAKAKADAKAAAPAEARHAANSGSNEPIVADIRTFSDKDFGPLLMSEDQKATLVIMELTTEFTQRKNDPLINKIEEAVGRPGKPGELQLEKGFPRGLELSLSGEATVGRDMRHAAQKSADATQLATVCLVIVLLFAIYRAPILAVIPLITVFVSVEIALKLLCILALHHYVTLFGGIEVYVTVVLYGAGIDYCMFLMARYKEELDNGATFAEAIATSVNKVGHALAASAGTVMLGIGMMIFCRFGKFQDAGIAMSSSLIFVLAASLTMTPALLMLAGRWAFWPRVQTEPLSTVQGWVSPTSMVSRLLERDWFGNVWGRIGDALLKRPGTIFLVAVLLMTPFAVIAWMYQDKLSYGLLSELPKNDPCVVGAAAVQAHFPPGITGPVTILVANRDADFHTDAEENDKKPGWQQIQTFSETLMEKKNELGIDDVRSVAYPLGMAERVQPDRIRRRAMIKRAQSRYVSDKDGYAGQVTRVDVVLAYDPFSPQSMSGFDKLRAALAPDPNKSDHLLPLKLNVDATKLDYLGGTPSIRDLKTVTNGDQWRIDILVPFVVFLVLVILLRKIATSAYLIATVFFSYLVTLGITFTVFYLLDRHGFNGLDWKVPMFLFTILVAVGEDYNILLMARIEEEQEQHGAVDGIVIGLHKTGGIISSCGIIMAGTFSSLMFGSLWGLAQLGFALAFGVLLDTFVVRPILVPAYLILLHQGFFGSLGRFLGAKTTIVADVPQPVGTVTSQRPNAQGATRVPAATPSASPALPDYPPRGT
ncbi:MAG TPA: MMPL family transporter [Planctomycetaceae bacterium]|nr:MMPL family transporter [Planctomycetaceae bacterium]